MSRWPLAALTLVLALSGSACSTSSGESSLVVFAATSLNGAFGEIGAAFETAHPGVEVDIAYGSSSTLREQILEGAPADIYASANPENMEAVSAEGMAIGEPVVFATNRMTIAVPLGNSAGVTGLADLAREELLVGLCAATVPCGDYGRRVLQAAGITHRGDTDEPSARFLVTKIEAGELDVGLVYRSDVVSSDELEGIDVPIAWNTDVRYPITVLSDADGDRAQKFVDFMLSPVAQRILADHGFGSP